MSEALQQSARPRTPEGLVWSTLRDPFAASHSEGPADEVHVPFDLIEHWLFEEALPFWADRGIDRANGGFVEELRLDGSDPGVDFKRVRVICRQIYVYSHAALLGFDRALDIAWHGYGFLVANAWLGPERGWARLLGRNGRVKDATPDLYDIAFVIFALGWFHRATGHKAAQSLAVNSLDFLDKQMRRNGGLGFLAQKPPQGPRLQNPHMHLLEASLVHLETTGSRRFRQLADELVELFCSKLFDPHSCTLAEYFTEDWEPAPGDAGLVTEPGHQFEWAWILASYQRITGRNLSRYIRPLAAFAEAYGVDAASGRTFNAIRRDGTVLDAGSRVWPNSERIQAAIALFEIDDRDPQPVLEQCARVLWRDYLSHEPRGTWLDHVGIDGSARTEKIPASTLYHLMIAFTEMLRVRQSVESRFPKGQHFQLELRESGL